jgi:hypothetical protein
VPLRYLLTCGMGTMWSDPRALYGRGSQNAPGDPPRLWDLPRHPDSPAYPGSFVGLALHLGFGAAVAHPLGWVNDWIAKGLSQCKGCLLRGMNPGMPGKSRDMGNSTARPARQRAGARRISSPDGKVQQLGNTFG